MLRAIMGFDHCQKNVVDSWIANSGWAIERHFSEPTAGKGIIVNSDAKLTTGPGSVATRSLFQINYSPYLSSGQANFLTIGFRTKIETAGFGNNDACLWFDYQRGNTGVILATMSGQFPTLAVGTEVFIECVINLATGGVEYYRNNALIASNANSLAGHVAQYKLGKFQTTMLGSSANNVGVLSYRDIYILDDVPGDGFTSRLGPKVIRPIGIDAVTPNDWTPSNGQTPLQILTAPTETANPGLMISASNLPIEVSLSSNIPADNKIEAIQVMYAGVGAQANSRIGAAIKSNGYLSSRRFATVGNTLKYGQMAGVLPRSPNGDSWTNASIDAASIVITPDQ